MKQRLFGSKSSKFLRRERKMWFALLNIGSVFALRSVREGDVMDEMAKTRREAAPWGVPGLVDLLKASITGSRDPSSPDVKETKLKRWLTTPAALECCCITHLSSGEERCEMVVKKDKSSFMIRLAVVAR